METINKGYVIINIGHPRSGRKYVCNDTFSRTKKEAIEKFMNNLLCTWKFWRDKFNFRYVKASQCVVVEEI